MTVTSTSMWGLALNASFEKQGDGLTHLVAYQDAVGTWTIGDGVTEYPDGSPVKQGDRLTRQQAATLNRRTLQVYERAVRQHVPTQLKQHEFDALVVFAYNVGITAFRTSTVVSYVLSNRMTDAAAHFGEWIYGTVRSTENADGTINWAQGPDGQPLELGSEWKRALRGLLRRHYAEACLFLGYDWSIACHEDNIVMEVESEWDPDYINADGKKVGRWKDRVTRKTTWEEVLRVAKNYPLDQQARGADRLKSLPKEQFPRSVPMAELPPQIDPNNGAKPMEATERFVGQMLITIGVMMRAMAGSVAKIGGIGGVVATMFMELVSNPTSLALLVGGIVVVIAAVQWVAGWVMERRGETIRQRGRDSATQVMI